MNLKIKSSWSKWMTGFFLAYLGWILISSLWLLFELKSGQFSRLILPAKSVKLALSPISWLTGQSWNDLEVIMQGTDLILTGQETLSAATTYVQLIWPESDDYEKRLSAANMAKPKISAWLSAAEQSWQRLRKSVWWRFVPPKYQQPNLGQIFLDLAQVFEYLTEGKKTVLIVFQNSQELRATGGFMGSYARLEIQDGLINQLEIQDIYQPAGQFQGYVAAPPGVVEYLSGGQGLKLPDANWWPDFPFSAQTVLNYFAYGKEQQVAGLVAVNLEVAEDLLRVFGPVKLIDYDQTVTADNLATVARADRDEFFPGSQQKAHFLTLLFNQLKLKMTELTTAEMAELVQLWQRRAKNKDLQFYSPNQEIQNIVETYGLSGKTSLQPNVFGELEPDKLVGTLEPLYLAAIESNVGINKANSAITRQVVTQVLASQVQVQIEFKNHHPKPLVPTRLLRPDLVSQRAELVNGLGYVNYQRLIFSPFLKVVSLTLGDQPISDWQEDDVTWSGVNLKQIGFLVTIPEAEKQTLTIALESDQTAPTSNFLSLPGIMVQKQSGVPATPYEIYWGNKSRSLILETDSFIKF